MHQARNSIGIFDSGIGGLTVAKQIIKDLPHENIVYFGDTARLPYGGKSAETILRYSIENSIFLMGKQIKLLVVACNTATAVGIERLQQIFNIPVVGVIEPGAIHAINATKNKRIAILGTKGTIQSGSYQKYIQKQLPDAKVFPIACPLLVPLIEENFINHPMAKMALSEYLHPIINQDIDTVVLGCTHYPLLTSAIRELLGSHTYLVDSGVACAATVKEILEFSDLCSKSSSLGTQQYFVSDDPEKFSRLGQSFLGMPISHVELAVTGV